MLLFLALTAGAYGVLGLLCSFFARKTVTATVVSLTVTIFLCVGTPIVAALLESFLRAASTDYSYQDPALLWLNPFYALFALVADLEPQGVGMISALGHGVLRRGRHRLLPRLSRDRRRRPRLDDRPLPSRGRRE